MRVTQPLVIRLLPVLDFGGVESRVMLQARLAREHGMRLRVCAFDKDGAAAKAIRATGIPVDILGIPARLGSLRATAALVGYLRRQQPDVVHASVVEANVHLCLAAPWVSSAGLIVEEVGQPSHSRRARLAFRALYRAPDRIVGVSKVTCDYLTEADGAPRDRVELIYNCADPRFFPEGRRSLDRSAERRAIRFLAVGRLHPIKNQARLLEAFALLRAQGVEAELTLAGDGPLGDELRRSAEDFRITSHMHFLGYREDVLPPLEQTDAFVLPSLSEGCSISLIEAMATGVPAIGSDVPGIREVLGEELAGEWTFPAHDVRAMAGVMRRFAELSVEQRAALGERAQARAYAEFSPERYMRRLEHLYDSARERARTRRR